MQKTIFVITALKLDFNTEEIVDWRVWGWYSKLKSAQSAVKWNCMDIYEEGTYTHVVIEEMPERIGSTPTEEYWYSALYRDKDDLKPIVYEIEKPEFLENTICFGIG